jgi:hypothetical protein
MRMDYGSRWSSKYLHGDLVSTVKHRLNDSPIWTDLLKIKNLHLIGRKVETKNGKIPCFERSLAL